MATYVSVTTNSFDKTREQAKTKAPQVNVRRPLRGIQVKPNTYSVLRVISGTGEAIPILDSSSPNVNNGIGTSDSYANFIVNRISEQRAEKQQIVETFGEDYVYFFGERPRFLDVSGVLVNTADFNWKSEFLANYDRYFRGTKLVELGARLYFYFDDVVVEGYMFGVTANMEADTPHMLPFQFQLFVTHYAILSTPGSVVFGPSDPLGYLAGTGATPTGLEPYNRDKIRADFAKNNAIGGSGGGLTGFLAKASSLVNDASFAIQEALQKVKDTLYARDLVVPGGLGSQVVSKPLDYQDDKFFGEAPTGQPIHTMTDEYVERSPAALSMQTELKSKAEIARVDALLKLEGPEILQKMAELELAKRGVDATSPSMAKAILGRGAFAAMQYAAPFAMEKAGGRIVDLAIADQAVSQFLL